MIEALHYEFMRTALAAGLLTSVICGVIGTLVVVNRIVFLAGGISHFAPDRATHGRATLCRRGRGQMTVAFRQTLKICVIAAGVPACSSPPAIDR